MIHAGGNTLRCEIHKPIKCIWNKEELPQQWEQYIIVPIYGEGDKFEICNYGGISLLPTT